MSGTAFWDTNLLIYWIEQKEPWRHSIRKLVAWQQRERVSILTSSLSLAEVLVQPLAKGLSDLARDYETILTEIGCLAFGIDEARIFAEIRAKHSSVKPPDCIQLACAAVHAVDYFITNDDRLSKVRVSGIGRIMSLDAVKNL